LPAKVTSFSLNNRQKTLLIQKYNAIFARAIGKAMPYFLKEGWVSG
jgi:hypothetical protein